MVGDQVIMVNFLFFFIEIKIIIKKNLFFWSKVNDEPVDKMTTAEIIELLRIIRGSICVVVIRKI